MDKNVIKKLFIIGLLLCSASVFAKGSMVPVDGKWKIKYGDDPIWSSIEFKHLDASWKNCELPGYIPVEKGQAFWLKCRVKIPSEFIGKKVYFETGHGYGASEIYINGAMVGGHGIVEPKVSFSHVSNAVVAIPEDCARSGIVEISMRCKTYGSHQVLDQFYFVDYQRYAQVKLWHPFMNNYVYYMMAAICFFLGFYFIFQFIADRTDKTSLYFSLTALTITVYFFDMATDILFLPFNFQLAIARYCFILSMGFLVQFICSMFEIKKKVLNIISIAVYLVFAALYIVNINKIPVLENLFTFSLIPIFSGIVYIYIILVRARKSNSKNAKIMLIGISIAMIFAIHDIVYQFMGKIPFAWLQGFSFFFIDMTLFIVVSLESTRNKKEIVNLAKSTSQQKDKLDAVIKDASRLSSETMEIANRLNESVQRVALSAKESEGKAQSIGEFISKQNESLRSTNEAVEKLIGSVEMITDEVEVENNVVNTAVGETKMMIEGVGKAAVGVQSAAEFASSLKKLTEASRNDIQTLVKSLEEIKESSAEIVSVVQIVSNFSRQTNMLAMNASIEAAHSGEAGKGFAVIAGEVNKLAKASGEQTKRIDEIITSITELISKSFDLSLNVKKVLNQVSEGAENTTIKVSESAQGLEIQRESGNRINDATGRMSESAMKVQKETLNQSEYSSMVSKNMDELSAFAEEAECAAGEIVTHNRELAEQASELKELSMRIKEASEDLDKLIKL